MSNAAVFLGQGTNTVDTDGTISGDGSSGDPLGIAIGGSDTQVQFNDSGVFGGDAGLTYNKTLKALAFPGNIPAMTGPVTMAGGDDLGGSAAIVLDNVDGYAILRSVPFFILQSPEEILIQTEAPAVNVDGSPIVVVANAASGTGVGGDITIQAGSAAGGGGAALFVNGATATVPGTVTVFPTASGATAGFVAVTADMVAGHGSALHQTNLVVSGLIDGVTDYFNPNIGFNSWDGVSANVGLYSLGVETNTGNTDAHFYLYDAKNAQTIFYTDNHAANMITFGLESPILVRSLGSFQAVEGFTLENGASVHPDTTDAHTMVFQVYDVNGTAYRTWLTATNGNAPDVTFSIPTTGTLVMQASTYKSSDGSSGITQDVTAATLAGKTMTFKNGLLTGFA